MLRRALIPKLNLDIVPIGRGPPDQSSSGPQIHHLCPVAHSGPGHRRGATALPVPRCRSGHKLSLSATSGFVNPVRYLLFVVNFVWVMIIMLKAARTFYDIEAPPKKSCLARPEGAIGARFAMQMQLVDMLRQCVQDLDGKELEHSEGAH